MNTTSSSLCIALALALGASPPALADHRDYRGDYHGGHRGDYRGEYRGHYPRPQYYGHHYGPSRGYGWVAPAAVLAIAGVAAGVAASNYYAPRPVYVAPQPVYVAPPSAYWNYCRSAGQYYPNVGYCPEGWQLVPAR